MLSHALHLTSQVAPMLMTWQVALLTTEVSLTRTHMFSILQARALGDFQVYEVRAHATSLEQAYGLCADLCNAAGVVRTIAVDELGSTVCVES